jgi:flagellar hook assembly protein FlgD
VNGLQEELELGRLTLAPRAALAAWPLPYRRGELTVSFAVSGRLGASSGTAEVGLYDVSGRLVKQLARGDFSEAQQILRWDGRNEQGGLVGNGLYFLLARSGGEETRLKVVVAR